MLFHRSIPARAAVVALIAGGGLAVPTFFADAADAVDAPCTATAAGGMTAGGTATVASSCGTTGTLTLQGGGLTATPPVALGWSASLATDADTWRVDTASADQSVEVDNLTGSSDKWKLTVQVSPFTNTDSATTYTLPSAGALQVNGDPAHAAGSTAPSATCVTGSTCSTVTNLVQSYPLAIDTGASSPTMIFGADTDTGRGRFKIGNLGWWIHVPANAHAGTYKSTITVAVVSAP